MLLDAVPCSKICVPRRARRWFSCPWRVTLTIEKGSAKRQLAATASTRARTGGRLRRLRDDLCVSVSILEKVTTAPLSYRTPLKHLGVNREPVDVCGGFHFSYRHDTKKTVCRCPRARRRLPGTSPAHDRARPSCRSRPPSGSPRTRPTGSSGIRTHGLWPVDAKRVHK